MCFAMRRVISLAFLVAVAAQPAPTTWSQFRNTPALSGVAASSLPASLRLQWTFDATAPVESSAAIADGTAYVGAGTGELIALDIATGKPKWKYRAASADLGIGESSPAVANGIVYIGDLTGVLHAVDAATGKARWTFKTGGEIKSSPVVAGDRLLIGSYDSHLYGLDPATGKQLWKMATDNYVHATPAIWNGVAYFGGCDEFFHGVRLADGKEVLELSAGGYTIASPAIAAGVAYFGTYSNEVIAIDIAAKRGEVAVRGSRSPVPVLLLGGACRRPRRPRRPRQDGACHRRGERQAAVVVRDARPRRFLSGHRGRSGRRRVG